LNKVTIETPSRIHITLIDLNGTLGRIDGGVGLALMEPKVKVEVEFSEKNEIVGDVENIGREALELTIKKLNLKEKFKINIKEIYPPHIGLGLTTQLSLAIAFSISQLLSLNLDPYHLAKIVNRGGTSGIGVGAFKFGGFLLDGGHSKKVKEDFLPSSFSRAPPPPLLVRYEFPEDWYIILACYKEGKRVYGKEELRIFKDHCPISLEEVKSLSHIILMKLLPSVIEKDIESFGDCIDKIQSLGFKRLEVNYQKEEVKNMMKRLKLKGGYGVGLSSFGPTIYTVTNSRRHAEELFEEALSFNSLCWITKAKNSGASLK